MFNRGTSRDVVRSVGHFPVIDAFGDLDDTRACHLAATVERLAADGHCAIVVSFSRVRRIGVAGLGAVLDACAAAARCGVTLAAVCPPESPIRLIVLAKVVTCVDVYSSDVAATAALDVDGTEWTATSTRRVA